MSLSIVLALACLVVVGSVIMFRQEPVLLIGLVVSPVVALTWAYWRRKGETKPPSLGD